jgi:DNA processing protein
VVGTRKPSSGGQQRAAKIAKMLVEDGFVIVSGLARGIDTVALTTAIKMGVQVIAVIGTAVCDHYPPENSSLQDEIAWRHLLISQVPVPHSHSEPQCSWERSHWAEIPADSEIFSPTS